MKTTHDICKEWQWYGFCDTDCNACPCIAELIGRELDKPFGRRIKDSRAVEHRESSKLIKKLLEKEG